MEDRLYSEAEMSCVGKAKNCGCWLTRLKNATSFPCEHDLSCLASIRRKAKHAVRNWPLDREQLAFIDRGIEQRSYSELVKYVREATASFQKVRAAAATVAKINDYLESIGGWKEYFRRVERGEDNDLKDYLRRSNRR